jgi:DNA-binding response OmpR family regulator
MKILLVEDNTRLVENISKILKINNYIVDAVTTGKSALIEVKVNEYDLVILDWMLPDIEGVDICKEIRSLGFTMPIMMLTAKTQLKDRVDGLNAGADDYLAKPFEVAELLARIRALLRREYRNELENKVKLGDLEIDQNKYTVARSGKPIQLSAKEFSLLDYLVKNKDRVLTRTEIYEHVWDSRVENMSNVVDVYIRLLRKKIDLNYPKKLIKTIKNVGYQICEN